MNGTAMFERFIQTLHLLPERQAPASPWTDNTLKVVPGYREFSARFAGCSFENGLYRVHDSVSARRAQQFVTDAFPEFASRVHVFAYDWLGRQFAVDDARKESGQPQVLLLEPGTGEALEIPVNFVEFHEQELVDYTDAALAREFFSVWSTTPAAELPLPRNQCVGYRVPLFLGGQDSLENLELIDIDVYWTLCGQLRKGVRGLPEGMSIRGLSISE